MYYYDSNSNNPNNHNGMRYEEAINEQNTYIQNPYYNLKESERDVQLEYEKGNNIYKKIIKKLKKI
jgi:hypothetical protein